MSMALLKIRDEVNVKIEGLDVEDRRALMRMFEYEVPYARYLPAVRLGRWNGKVSFFQLGGSTYTNLLPEILDYLVSRGYEVELDDTRDYPRVFDLEAVAEDTFRDHAWPQGHPAAGQPVELRDYQVEIINRFLNNPQCLQEVATGAGKCQPLSSRVLTPTGWTTMGELLVGDTVITPAGKKSKVLNVFNPGIKDVYEITFADGRTARSCGDHIWPVYNIAWKKSKTGPWRNLSLHEIIRLKSNTKRSIGVPLVSMEYDNEDIDLPMDPWLMGFLLGDGSFRHGLINFSTGDAELVAKVQSKLDPDYTIKHLGNYDYAIKFASDTAGHAAHGRLMKNKPRNPRGHIISSGKFKSSANKYRQIINDLGLGETYSNTKFIPEVFFKGSLNQRLELIRGLTDSDGTVDKASVYFISTSQSLAKGFQRLIRSVGGIARLSTKTNRTYVYNGVRKACLDSHTVSTKFPRPWELLSLPRKQQKTNFSYQYGDTLKLNIVDIKKVSTEEVRCIYIDDPSHLYITDEYIVTHNTLITAALSRAVSDHGRSIVIVPNKSLVTQTEKDYINLDLDVGVYFGDRKEFNRRHTICTWQSLNNLLKNTKSGEADVTITEFLEDVVCVIVDECLDGDSRVLTPTGYISIKDIQAGDEVINYSESSKTFKVDTVVKQHINLTNSSSEQMYELEFDNGSKIQVTGNHKFLTNLGWVRADCLTEQHEIVHNKIS